MTLLQVIGRVDGILSFPEFSRDFAAGLDLIRPEIRKANSMRSLRA